MKKLLFNTILLLLVTVGLKAQSPVAAFSGSTLAGCSPLGVAFRDESTGSPKYWDWEFTGPGMNQLSNQQNPSITFSQPGTYTITLVVRNSNGANAITKTDYITVYPSPSVSFTADKTLGCLPAAIQFTGYVATSVGTIQSVEWNFGDDSKSNETNPAHAYAQTGYYTVSLSATSSNNCTSRSIAARYIRVVGGIESDFTATPSANCQPPFTVSFSNQSSGPGGLSYDWNLGNGATSQDQNPIANYNASNTYNVQLITRSSYGCSDTTQKQVNVTSYNTSFTSSQDTVCINQDLNFQNTSSADVVSFGWDFGDGSSSFQQNPVKRFGTAGSYTVKLVNKFAYCSDSVSKTIVVTDKPVVDFTATNNQGCGTPLSVNFQNTTPGTVAWQWDFGDGTSSGQQNPDHTYNNKGNYAVTLNVTNTYGCQSSVSKPQFVRIIPPKITLTNAVASGCAPLNNVAPVATVTAIDGIASYQWDWGDGTSANTATPVHNYPNAGVYTILLTVTTNGGCTDTASTLVKVGTPPHDVDFTFDPGGVCVSDSSSFTGIATNANEWLWNFNDGTTSILQNPKHAFRDTGNFTITLTALNNGCPAPSVSKLNIIKKDPPVANFAFAVDCSNKLAVTFTDKSILDTRDTDYTWDFGNGKTSNATNPGLYTYTAYGKYKVSLTVNNGICKGAYDTVINVTPLDSSFTVSATDVCRGQAITVTANEAQANVASYLWSIDGGNTYLNRGKSFDITLDSLGANPLKLKVTDLYGCVGSSSQTVDINGLIAGFVPSAKNACKNTSITFTDQSSAANGITSWIWDFGDGQTQTYTAPGPFTHQYQDTGRFVVRLLVRDAFQCFAEFVLPDTIHITGPSAAFNMPEKYCPGLDVPVVNNSEGFNLTYQWNFGDGYTTTDWAPVHAYTSEGPYTVQLSVEDAAGCRDSVVKTNYLQVLKPVADFDVIDSFSVCQVLESKFPFKARNYESVLWDFGDGGTSTKDSTVRNFYALYGNYEVKLYAYGYGGCVDSASRMVNVFNPNSATQINYTIPPLICNEVAVDFNVVVPSDIKFYFNFGDGGVDSSGQTNLTHLYNYPRSYNPSLFLTDPTGCQASKGGGSINVRGAVPVFNLDKKSFCDSGTVYPTNYTISNDGIASQIWDFGDGQTSTVKDPPPHSFTTAGLYLPTLTVTTNSGCTSSFTDTVRVPRTPRPLIQVDPLTCVDRLVLFNGQLAQPDTAIRWNWNFGDGRSSTQQNNNITYNNPGRYTIKLNAANFLGCSGDTSLNFTVAPLPVINVQNVVMPVGGQIQLPVTYSPGAATYFWAPPEGLSCTNCPNPVAKPQFTQTYQVIVTDSNTCVSSANVTVQVLCSEENYFVPNTFSPNGDGVNEVFYPRGKGLARVQSMKIFNRWGQLVFDRRNFMANDASMGWRGTANGQPVPPDVYVYVIEFVCDNAQIVPMKGNVTLVR